MSQYYFAPPQLRFWVAGERALAFWFVLGNAKMNMLTKRSGVEIN